MGFGLIYLNTFIVRELVWWHLWVGLSCDRVVSKGSWIVDIVLCPCMLLY